MTKYLTKIIDTIDAVLYSGENSPFNLSDLKYFREIIERWLRKVNENIKYLEENK